MSQFDQKAHYNYHNISFSAGVNLKRARAWKISMVKSIILFEDCVVGPSLFSLVLFL